MKTAGRGRHCKKIYKVSTAKCEFSVSKRKDEGTLNFLDEYLPK